MSDFKFNVSETDSLVIREGQAKPINKVLGIEFSGALHAPLNFIKGKLKAMDEDVLQYSTSGGNLDNLYVPERSTLYADRDEGTLKLVLNEKNEYRDIVKGSLLESKDLADFEINSGRKFTQQALISVLKKNKIRFTDAGLHSEIVANLYNFSGTVKKTFEKSEDIKSGRKVDYVQFEADHNMKAPEIKLTGRLFKGYDAVTFNVSVNIDVTDGDVRFYFESEELYALQEEIKDKAIDEQIEGFSVTFACSVVEV